MRSRVKVLAGIALIGGLFLVYGQPRYNVLKDPSFELNSEAWEEFAAPETIATVSRHSVDPNAPDGDYVGVLSVGIGGQGTMENPYRSGTAKLTQEFIPRIVSDFDFDTSLVFWVKWMPTGRDGHYEWGIRIFGVQGETLEFKNPGKQDTWTNVKQGNIYELWKGNGLSETDSLYKIELWASSNVEMEVIPTDPPETTYTLTGEAVSWDLILLYSKRPDLDAGMVSIDSPDKMEEGYEPKATVKNFGAMRVSFPVICDISENGEVVYSDTLQVDSLLPDSTTQITFEKYPRTYSPSIIYSIKCYTLLDGDQNSENDSLAKSLTGVLEKREVNPVKVMPSIFVKEMTIFLSKGSRATLYNINGGVVKEIYGKGEIKIGRSLSPGVYFLITPERREKLIKAK